MLLEVDLINPPSFLGSGYLVCFTTLSTPYNGYKVVWLSFFANNIDVRAPHAKTLGLIRFLSSNFYNCSFSSYNLQGSIQYQVIG